MSEPAYILLYVDSPARSASFYADLLNTAPVEASSTFALFVLNSRCKLGLWARHNVEPKVTTPPGGAEIALMVGNEAAVHDAHTAWRARGLTIIQTPVAMDFGFTFTALDPDGHRLRVFAPHDQQGASHEG